MFNTLEDARKSLGDEKLLHNLNQFMKERAKRMEYNKKYNKVNRADLKEYRAWRETREDFREDFSKLRS